MRQSGPGRRADRQCHRLAQDMAGDGGAKCGPADAECCDERTPTEAPPAPGPPCHHRHQTVRELRKRCSVHGGVSFEFLPRDTHLDSLR